MMKRFFVILAALAMVASACGSDEATTTAAPATTAAAPATTAAPVADAADEGIGVAMLIADSTCADEGYFLTHCEGLEAIGAMEGVGWTALEEFIPVTEEYTQLTEQYIADGASVVIDPGAVGDVFLDGCSGMGVACFQTYGLPDADGNFADDVVAYYPRHWESAYLSGVAAGHVTETGHLGYVVSFDVPLIVANVNAFLMGCQSVRSDCTISTVTINSWFDPPQEVEATNALVNGGADVLFGFIDDPSVIATAEERGVWAVTMFKDMRRFGENAYLTSALMNWDEFYTEEVGNVLNGTWSGGRLELFDLGVGHDIDAFGANVPADAQSATMAVRQEMLDGTFNPFVGPLYDTNGEMRIAAGEELTDDFLYSQWDWYINGVGDPVATTAAPPTIDRLVTGLGQNPVSMDPQTITQLAINQIVYAVYDPLVWQLVVDGKTEIFPGLAESWEVSDDLTEYTFNLRSGVNFHDGTPFNADAVKFMLDRIQDESLEAAIAQGMVGPYSGSEVIDDHTVKVSFSDPNGGFLTALSTKNLLIPSPTAIESMGADYAFNPVGTGAFKFVEFVDQQHVLLERNLDYNHGPAPLSSGPSSVGELEFRVLTDAIAQVNAVQTGEIHVAHSPPLSVQNLGGLESGGFTVLRGASRGTPFSYIFNTERITDVRVRQALSHAVDKQRLVDTVFQGQYAAASAVVTQSTPGFPGKEFYPFDPDRARALLDEAGWLVGDGGKRYKDGEQLVLEWWNMTDFPIYDEMAPFIQAQYSELLGVDVNINSQSWPGIGDTLKEGIHDVAITSLTQPDGLSSMNILLTCAMDARNGGFNWSFYCNEGTDAAIAAARQMADGPEKYAATEAIVTQIMEDAPYIPMLEPQVVVVHPSEIGGIAFNGVDGVPLYHAVTSAG